VAPALMTAAPAYADAVAGQGLTRYGRVSAIAKETVTIDQGCARDKPLVVPWSQIEFIKIDADCATHPVEPPVAGLVPCTGNKMAGFKVYLSGAPEPATAKAVWRSGDEINYEQFNGTVSSGAYSALKGIVRTTVCLAAVGDDDVHVEGFCDEPRQLAVNYAPSAVSDNTIFTRGFAIYVEHLTGDERAAAEGPNDEDIRESFGSALTLWTSALLRMKNAGRLPGDLTAYVNASVSRGGAYSLLTPPQVVRVRCRGNAMVVVRVGEQAARFQLAGGRAIALSQTEGRMLFLNTEQYRFKNGLHGPVSPGDIELVSVMTHELGHSFGLRDVGAVGAQSVMSAEFLNPFTNVVEPTDQDAEAFVAVLKQSIAGAAPGVFNSEMCSGLRDVRPVRARVFLQ